MSEFKIKALEFAASLGHKEVLDLLASAAKIESYITGEVVKAEAAVKAAVSGKKAVAGSAASTVAPASAPEKAAATAAPSADLDAIRKAMVKLISKNLRDQITETFTEFGAADASSLKPANYAAVLAKFNDFLSI